MPALNVAIIGAGWAGLSAGVTLVDAGVPTTLFESSHVLGGRARQITINEQIIDNGIHLLSGAYTATLALLSQIQIPLEPLDIDRQPFKYSYGPLRINTPRLPFPAKQLLGFLFARGLNLTDKLAALKFLQLIKAEKLAVRPFESVQNLLLRHQQTDTLIELLWNPICISALNIQCERGCASVFTNVISDALLGPKGSSDMLFPKSDLTSLFASRAGRYIEKHEGILRLGYRAKITQGKNNELTIKDSNESFSHIVVATSPHNVRNVFEESSMIRSSLNLIDQFTYEPIYTVYHQYKKNTSTNDRMIGLNSPYAHWVFDRGITHQDLGLIGVIISGSGLHQNLTNEQLASKSANVLNDNFGFGTPLWSQVLAEKRATFSCTPGLKRPTQITDKNGIILAGDYTYQRYPATLEAAVRSGMKASDIIIKSL
ncbi:MAG: hydroxysqualene dehydroxylase HpnE [Proteobacteria bacterium]|nr:hydroxysqualene dehydroxylase HpnE [Pseudomonadota bacterium]MDA1332121.1 hydroxysqualene dehydroxylase HpnE [Pseudomonadota bacterium]